MNKKSNIIIPITIEKVQVMLESRINLPIFRFADGFITFKGKKVGNTYKLIHRAGKTSRKVNVELIPMQDKTMVFLSIKPTMMNTFGINAGCLLVVLFGLVVLGDNFFGGFLVVVIGIAPLFLRNRLGPRVTKYYEGELLNFFSVRIEKS